MAKVKRTYKKPSQGRISRVRARLLKANGRVCAIGKHEILEGEVVTIDHIIPLSKGGKDKEANMQLACAPCNKAKGNKLPARVWSLDEADLPAEFHVMREIFLGPAKRPDPAIAVSDRKRNESLHDYFVRKGWFCPCRVCKGGREAAARPIMLCWYKVNPGGANDVFVSRVRGHYIR